MFAGRTWTEDERQDVYRRCLSGEHRGSVAESYGVSISSIHSVFFKVMRRREDWLHRQSSQRLISRQMLDRAVANASALYHVPPSAILGRSQTRQTARARWFAMWWLRERKAPDGKPLYGYIEIGAAFGRDHSTAMNAVRKHERLQSPTGNDNNRGRMPGEPSANDRTAGELVA